MPKLGPDKLWDMAEKLGSVLFDKGTSRHYLQIFCRWPGSKKSKRHSIYASSETEARKILRRIQGEVAHGAKLYTVLARYVGDRSRNAFIKRWHAFCDEKDQDVQTGRIDADRVSELRKYEDRNYLEFFSSAPLHTIDKPKLVAWIRWMRKKKLSEKTIKNVLHDIGHFLRWLSDQGDIAEAPIIPSNEIKLIEYDPQIPEADVVERVLAEIPEEERGIFLVRSYMGLRPSESRRLNVADLRVGTGDPDLADAAIHLPPPKTKTKRPRKLQLHPEVAAWLVQHGDLDRFGGEPLFTNPDADNAERRWMPGSERRALERAYKAAKVAWIKPNEFGRHFFATHAVSDLHADIFPVQAWLEHTDPRTTQRYAKMRPMPIARILDPKANVASQVPQTKTAT